MKIKIKSKFKIMKLTKKLFEGLITLLLVAMLVDLFFGDLQNIHFVMASSKSMAYKVGFFCGALMVLISCMGWFVYLWSKFKTKKI